MSNNKYILLICLITAYAWPTAAQQAGLTYTLHDCIRYTIENSANIKTAKIQEQIADKKVNEVIGSGLPQIQVTGNIVNNLELPAQIIPGELFGGAAGSQYKLKFGTKFNTTFTGQANQMLFNGSFWVGLDAAKSSETYYRQGTEVATDNTLYTVAVSYYRTLMAEKQIQLMEFNITSLKRTLADTKLLRDNGKAKNIDVDRLQVNYNNLQHQLKNIQEQVQQQYNQLKYLMGMPVDTRMTVRDATLEISANSPGQLPVADSLSFSDTRLYEDRSDFRQLLTSRELQSLSKKNEWMKYVPSLSAFGSYTWSAQKNSFSFSSSDWMNYYSVGIQLSVPIFTGGQTYARIQQADLTLKQIDEQIKDVKSGIDMQAENARIAYRQARLNIECEIENVELAKKVYQVTEAEYREGTNTAAALVDAETRLREAQTNYINSLLNLHVAVIDVEKAKGTIGTYLKNLEN
ncbi:MAG: TolC family protein [Ignavibacteria bacterium]|nr:TolC family protein [Ignavibacteria bacterium]